MDDLPSSLGSTHFGFWLEDLNYVVFSLDDSFLLGGFHRLLLGMIYILVRNPCKESYRLLFLRNLIVLI